MNKFEYLKNLEGRDIPPAAFMVLVFIFNRTDANLSNGFPTAEYLSNATGFSVRHVRKQIAWLTESRYIVKTQCGRSGRATVYALTLPAKAVESARDKRGEPEAPRNESDEPRPPGNCHFCQNPIDSDAWDWRTGGREAYPFHGDCYSYWRAGADDQQVSASQPDSLPERVDELATAAF